MEKLYERRCEACRPDAPMVSKEEADQLLQSIPAWRRETHDGVEKLIRQFHFKEFRQAINFTYKVASMADREDHHPGIFTEWGKVTVYWWTHKINGLHMNDFIMAAKTDIIANQKPSG